MNSQKKYVVIDVETTGNNLHKNDRIIEIGVTVMAGMDIKENYSTFVNCGRKVPPFITRLTGIEDEHLRGAPMFSEIAPLILEYLESACFVAHNVDFDLQFLNTEFERAGYAGFQGEVLDTVEMARLLYPTQESYRLEALSDSFQVKHLQPHRAGSDAFVTAQLLQCMTKKLQSLPKVTLERLEPYTRDMRIGLHTLVHETVKATRQTAARSRDFRYDMYRGLAFKKRGKQDDIHHGDDQLMFSAEKFFGPSGKLAQTTPTYEYRKAQVEIASGIREAFSERQHLLIEAATGTGKTLAYLYPAVLRSRESKKPLIVATETVALQQQIKDRDLPFLEEALQIPVRGTVLKGRAHYLCLQKFEHFLTRMPASYDEQLTAGQLLVWLTETDEGDVEELNLPNGGYALWEELKSDAESCSNPSCPFFSRCYYQRAKAKAQKADIIITNHALLFTDRFQGAHILPAYDQVIIDEAHHIEETAGRHLGKSSSYQHFMTLLNRFGGQAGQGLFSHLDPFLREGRREHDDQWLQVRKNNLSQLQTEWHQLFSSLQAWAFQRKPKEMKQQATAIYDPSVLSNEILEIRGRIQMVLSDELKAWESFVETFRDETTTAVESLLPKVKSFVNDLQKEHELLWSLLIPEEGQVYWMESDADERPDRLRLYQRPIDIGERLSDQFFPGIDSFVLISATLTMNDSFQYIIDQAGLADDPPRCIQIPSPFNYGDQTELFIPDDLPDIRYGDNRLFIEASAEFVSMLTAVVKGRMLVLFTSYGMLRKTYHVLKPMLEEMEYELLGQGMHGINRAKLIKKFRKQERAVLLGTSTFWEGIDLPGDEVRALIIARLPFSPPDDPVYKAKAERLEKEGRNPFMELALPRAVLRFKQGFGRLIRSENDRGLVFVLDKRLIKARYGKKFIRSLPEDVPVTYANSDHLLTRAEEFYTRRTMKEV